LLCKSVTMLIVDCAYSSGYRHWDRGFTSCRQVSRQSCLTDWKHVVYSGHSPRPRRPRMILSMFRHHWQIFCSVYSSVCLLHRAFRWDSWLSCSV